MFNTLYLFFPFPTMVKLPKPPNHKMRHGLRKMRHVASSLPWIALLGALPFISTAEVSSSNIAYMTSWYSGSTWIMQGQCILPLTESMNTFYIKVTLDRDTTELVNWIATEHSKDSNGMWYMLKNIWPFHPPQISFDFQLKYDSGNPPTGTCSLLTSPDTSSETTTTTAAPTTAAPTTAAPTTAAPTTSAPTTAAPTTAAPTTTAPTTAAPTTAAPTTAAPTTAPTTTTTTTSPSGVSTKYNYGEVIRLSILFYEAQRSGQLPATNRIPYRGDSALNDQGFNGEDLTGGWYDAGDGVKFNLPMASATTILAWGLSRWTDAYISAGQLDWMYDSIKWPLDYFIKAWNENQNIYYCQVGDPDLDHSFWGRHEEMTMNRPAYAVTPSAPGSDVAGETAAALAAGAIAFSSKDATYATNLLSKAETLYSFAKTYQGKYSDSVSKANPFYTSNNGFKDELCFAAIMLYKATQNNKYLQDAVGFTTSGTAWSMSWDEKTVACQLLLFQETGLSTHRAPVENFLNHYINEISTTPCGLAWRLQWGSNRYSANAAFIALMAADTQGFKDAEQYKTWAMSQIHYMLGENKYGISYQIGFGSSYPKKPHHRASSCPDLPQPCTDAQLYSPSDNPQTLYGALIGGPDVNDNYADVRTDYVQNEVACDYNAGFQSAAAGLLHFALQGNLPAAPVAKCP